MGLRGGPGQGKVARLPGSIAGTKNYPMASAGPANSVALQALARALVDGGVPMVAGQLPATTFQTVPSPCDHLPGTPPARLLPQGRGVVLGPPPGAGGLLANLCCKFLAGEGRGGQGGCWEGVGRESVRA